jgi:hypothetical protein
MNLLRLVALFGALPLAGCIFGSAVPDAADAYLRKPSLTTSWETATLPRGGTVSGRLTHCPEVILQRVADRYGYVHGRYRLGFADLPAGVSVSFPEGDTLVVPAPGEPGYDALPSPLDLSQRYCQTRAFTLSRSVGSDFGPSAFAAPTAQHEVESAQLRGERVRLNDAPVAAPPPAVAGSCAVGRWTAVSTPVQMLVSTLEFDVALDKVEPNRVTVVRATEGSVLVDEDFGGWRQSVIPTATTPENVRVARSPTDGLLNRTLVAWRETDFRRPREEQSRVMLAWESGSAGWQAEVMAVGLQASIRGLQLATSQIEAVVGWVGDGGPRLRVADVLTRGISDLPLPADLPADGSVRVMRLATDPLDQSLLLALAVREADGVTRLRVWRRTMPGAGWVPLQVLNAGAPDASAALGDIALTAADGEVLLAWSWGDTAFFSSNARQQLQLQRWTPATGWRAVADTTLLPDAARRYALQPQSLQVGAGCGGAAFMAWAEPADYPRGAVHGAVAADNRWDTFGRNNLAPLPDGTGAYASLARLRVGVDGRPLLAVLLAAPTGGPAPMVLLRYTP